MPNKRSRKRKLTKGVDVEGLRAAIGKQKATAIKMEKGVLLFSETPKEDTIISFVYKYTGGKWVQFQINQSDLARQSD